MARQREMTPSLVPPKVWQQVLDQQRAQGGISDSGWRLGLAVLSGLHSRHVGISPDLAFGLARALSQDHTHYDDVWHTLDRRLRRVLNELAGLNEAMPAQYELLLQASFSYVVFQLVEPLINAACVRLNHNYLFCEDRSAGRGSFVNYSAYRRYSTDLRSEFEKIVNGTNDALPDLFWQDRAEMLSMLTRQRHQPTSDPLSTVDLVDMGVFLKLKPEIGTSREKHRQIQVPQKTQTVERKQVNPGSESVRLTTRVEDLHRQVLTEYLYPDILRMDRILNSGYWIIKPPPKPIRLQDALIIGLMPAPVATSYSSAFLKTCWFDFVLRFSHLLRTNHLANSEFWWIEADAYHQERRQVFSLQDAAYLPTTLDAEQSPAYRALFRRRLGWLPGYMKQVADFTPLDDLSEQLQTAGAGEEGIVNQWLRQAWERETRPTRQRRRNNRPLRISEYGYVHVMVFLPAPVEDNPAALTSRRQLARLLHHPENRISITYVPNLVAQPWNFDGQVHFSASYLLSDPITEFDAPTFAGMLVATWLDNIMRELRNG